MAEKSEKKTDIPAPKKLEPIYSMQQLIDGYREFGTSKAVVSCALKLAGKDNLTTTEARKIIDTFRQKEVK